MTPPSKHDDDSLLREAARFPHVERGQRVGLFGGSFNPPHEGHLHVSETALIRGALDQVWWMVTPGNPLKDHSELAPLAERIRLCRQVARHPGIKVTAFEARYKVNYTEQALTIVKRYHQDVRFIWLMGADNLAGFHRWQNWRRIAGMMPIMVVDRPGSTLAYRSARAAIALSRYRVDETDSELLADLSPPAWTFIHAPRNVLSSTAIRNSRKNGTAD
ncbi:nicotinate-nucleotide adenylyltransferase [Salaquimonas pukyongi]|uniref:nicotinate-nucleotide adenylyltransferase n=1 Tax=Salaquimonas pukyongi TaxID=2712698 RepID=UPI001FCDDEFE|nr:nicotinate-nucleotide adenylyltransferase [Salaquimonas pukyongi]